MRDLVYFVLACFLAAALELYIDGFLDHEVKLHPKGVHDATAERLFELNGLYQWLVTSGLRKPIQKFTILVDVAARNDRYYSSLFNQVIEVCERHKALADLIDRMASASPSTLAPCSPVSTT